MHSHTTTTDALRRALYRDVETPAALPQVQDEKAAPFPLYGDPNRVKKIQAIVTASFAWSFFSPRCYKIGPY